MERPRLFKIILYLSASIHNKMKKYIAYLFCLICPMISMAQATKTNGVSGPARQITFSDPGIKDYDIHLVQLDQHPIPSAEYGTKKDELNMMRTAWKNEAHKTENKKKTRGLAVNPSIFKGVQGNTSNSVPNDNDIAVSNDGKVVSVVNSNIRIYDDTLLSLIHI